MKKVALYAAAILGSHLLYSVSELWYGAEWLFGLLAIGWYSLFLLAWKRIDSGGAGLIVVTAFILLYVNSIFIFQNLPAGVYSFLIGLLLIPFYRKYRDVGLTSIGFVLVNLLISIETESLITMWLMFFTNGALALTGFRLRLLWLKRCFTVLFALTAAVLLVIYWFDETPFIFLMVIGGIIAVVAVSYKFSRQPLA